MDEFEAFAREVEKYGTYGALTKEGAASLWRIASNIQIQVDADMISGPLKEHFLSDLPIWASKHGKEIWPLIEKYHPSAKKHKALS